MVNLVTKSILGAILVLLKTMYYCKLGCSDFSPFYYLLIQEGEALYSKVAVVGLSQVWCWYFYQERQKKRKKERKHTNHVKE